MTGPIPEDACMKTLSLEFRDEVAWVGLNRPDKHNAMNLEMIDELIACARALRRRRDLRAVVIHGHGPSFCAGMDLMSIFSSRTRKLYALSQLLRPSAGLFQRVNLIWRRLPMPVIALVHGHCYGAGMQLALGADISFVHEQAQLSLMESKWGMIPDMGALLTLRGRVAPDLAKELIFTARVIDASQAQALGLISHCSADPQQDVEALLAELRLRSPDALAAAKKLVDGTLFRRPWRILLGERLWQLRLILGRNHRIAIERNRKSTDRPYAARSIS